MIQPLNLTVHTRTKHRLTHIQKTNMKAKDKSYRVCDDAGLYIHVKRNGNKTWEFGYIRSSTGNPSYIGLGTFRLVSLVEAREKALELSKLVSEGIDLHLMKTQQITL